VSFLYIVNEDALVSCFVNIKLHQLISILEFGYIENATYKHKYVWNNFIFLTHCMN
jgi:hypothetical protein